MFNILCWLLQISNKYYKRKSLTFPVDPVVMAQFMTRAKVVKMIEEYVRKTGVFGTGEMSGLVYEMDEFLAEWRKEVKKRKELLNN